MALTPIDERGERSIMHTLTLSDRAPKDPHPRASYLTGVQLAIVRYNKALKARKSEADVAEVVGQSVANSIFRDGHPRDERITLMAAQAGWPQDFTRQVEGIVEREEEKFKTGQEKSNREAFFATRAEVAKKRGGFNRWRGDSE